MTDASDSLAIDRLVLEAASLDTGERAAYWRRQTGNDPRLIAAVEERLALAATLPTGFLAVPAAEMLDDVSAARDADDGEAILATAAARYEVGDVLGEGGMAVVHSAFDRQLRRQVALKLFEPDDPRSVDPERFLHEARAQAKVRHDHVLAIHDVGEIELDGELKPYLTMDRVEGGTLDEVADEMSLESRVRLVIQAAEGLHAAHRRGLVHRDVKPSNILVESVDGVDTARVTDFGIALSEGHDAAVVAGTPAYLAPEQLAGSRRVDRRVDVWGLGATLFRTVCGRLPFDGDSVSEILEKVRSVEVPEFPADLPRDLVAIIERALQKDPERRYPSARALAADLRRFLDGEPVEAVTSTWAYRLSKWLIRHRRLMVVAVAGSIALTAALGVAAWQGLAARAANERAEARRGQAERLMAFMLGDLRDKLAAVGRLDVLEAVGEQAMAYFSAVPEMVLSDDELSRRSQALYQVGSVLIEQGRTDDAARSFDQSLELARRLVDRYPGDLERRFDLGQSEFWVGAAHFQEGDLARAETNFEAYRAISEGLVEARPENSKYRLEAAYSLSNLGSLHRQRGELARAERYFRRSLTLFRDLVDEEAKPELIFELAAGHNLLALVLLQDGRLDEAGHQLEAEYALRRRLADLRPGHIPDRRFLGTSLDYLADHRLMLGDSTGARGFADQAQEVYSGLVDHDPDNRLWRWSWQVCRATLAKLARLSGRFAESATRLDEIRASIGDQPDDRMTAQLHWMLAMEEGQLALARGAPTRARQHLDEAIGASRQLVEASPDDAWAIGRLARSLVLRGWVLSDAGEPEAARSTWDDAARVLERSESRSVESQALRASILLGLDRPDDAAPLIAALHAAGFAHPDYPELAPPSPRDDQ